MSASPVSPGHGSLYVISLQDSQRIQIWRFWMALLVPLNHAYTTPNRSVRSEIAVFYEPEWLEFVQHVLVNVISRCVPSAFALISAVLLFRKPFTWKNNVLRKCRSLLLPLFLLTGFWIAVYAIGQHLPFVGGMFSSESTRVVSWTMRQWFAAFFGWTKEHQMPTILYPLWFLRDLMLMNLIAPVMKRTIDCFPRLCLAILAWMLVLNTDSRFYYYTVRQVFIYFCLGYYIVKYNFHFSDLDKIPGIWIGAMYAACIAASYLLQNYTDFRGTMQGISNLIGVLFFARSLSSFTGPERWKKYFLQLSEYSIAVFLFHERMLTFFKRLLLRMLPVNLGTTLLLFYALPSMIVSICICIARFLQKTQPRLYNCITGGR